MYESEHIKQIIFDLIRINEDGIECYDNLLKNVLTEMREELFELIALKIFESRQNIRTLQQLIHTPGINGISCNRYMAPGQIFTQWRNRKIEVHETCQYSLLNRLAHEEQFALEAYKLALLSKYLIDHDCRTVLMDQKHALQLFSVKIESYGDLEALTHLDFIHVHFS